MFRILLPAALATLLPAVEAPYPGLTREGHLTVGQAWLGQEVRTRTLTPDPERLTDPARLGYTADEVRRWFGTPRTVTLDATGLDRRLITPVPAAGIHPRVLFNPEDLPGLRERLGQGSGKILMAAIRRHLEAVLTGPKASAGAEYANLAAGDAVGDLLAKPEAGNSLVYEAFRCLVDEDAEGGRRLAAALATQAPLIEARIAANVAAAAKRFATETAKGQTVVDGSRRFVTVAQEAVFQGTYGLAYDLAHGWMDEAQRTAVRRALVAASTGMTLPGAEGPRAWPAGVTNHLPLENRLILVAAAIEGEPGADPGTWRRCVEAQTSFVANVLANGEVFESWGKYFLFYEHLIIMAKRGDDLVAAANLRAVINDWFIAALDPWGGSWSFTDGLAGTGQKLSRPVDLVVYRALFPDDAAGAFVLRQQTGGDLATLVAPRVNTRHPAFVTDALIAALYARDLPSAAGERERVLAGRPLASISEDTGNLIARSSWEQEDLVLHHWCRALPGGYAYADRSHISLYGLGRAWGTYARMRQEKGQYAPGHRSVVLCDGEGPSPMPGRLAALADGPLASATAVDLRPAWTWQHLNVAPAPAGTPLEPLPLPFNAFRRIPSTLPWMDLPARDLPHWDGDFRAGPKTRAFWWKRPLPIQRAFRTAALVRGSQPYALVVDDLQQDGQERTYTWAMSVADDLTLAEATTTGTPDAPMVDLVLAEPGGARSLLVRALAAPALDPAQPGRLERLVVANPPQKDLIVPSLRLTSRATNGDHVVLLWPFRSGQSRPTTTWCADRRTLTIAWSDQTDVVTCIPGEDGRRRLQIERQGTEILSMQ